MITNAERKFVKSLAEAKHRKANGMFVAEGSKCVEEFLGKLEIVNIYALNNWRGFDAVPAGIDLKEATRADMERMTSFNSIPDVVAVFKIPEYQFDIKRISQHLTVALDQVQDPGNLGTILRLCDWYGVEDILLSEGCASPWNPKTVQASMGALARVRTHIVDLPAVAASWSEPVAVTLLEGENIYSADLPQSALVVFGNEGSGVSEAVKETASMALNIPSYPPSRPTSESLNVASAASITLSEFRRRLITKS